jgi:hypothetical protein
VFRHLELLSQISVTVFMFSLCCKFLWDNHNGSGSLFSVYCTLWCHKQLGGWRSESYWHQTWHEPMSLQKLSVHADDLRKWIRCFCTGWGFTVSHTEFRYGSWTVLLPFVVAHGKTSNVVLCTLRFPMWRYVMEKFTNELCLNFRVMHPVARVPVKHFL